MPSPGQGDICCVQRTARRLVGLDRVERARAEMGGGTDRQPADSPQMASMAETEPQEVLEFRTGSLMSLSGSFALSAPQRTNCVVAVEEGGVTQVETET